MQTEILNVAPYDKDLELKLEGAAKIIKQGGLVVFPTETVYGLGADATNDFAAKKIYKAKGRPSDNPLIIHISQPVEAEKYTYTNELYYKLADCFMPGPLTVVLKARESIPSSIRAGLDTVAVRCPENPIARELIRLSGVPIAAPSANISGSPSPTTAEHVISDMSGRVDMIIDGGESDIGIESTIVKINDDGTLTLLRPGKITIEELLFLGIDVEVAASVTEQLKDGEKVLSPGMKYRHYAPKAPVVLLDGNMKECCEYVKKSSHKKVCLIAYSDEVTYYSSELNNITVYDFGNKESKLEQARLLFSLLRKADSENFDIIYAPLPEKEGVGLALYNRMIRAAAYKIIRL